MMTKIMEAFKQTDDFKKELRESEKIPDFEKYLDERLSADEKTQLHKERFEIGFGSTVESKVHNMHMEFMRSDAKNNYTKFHFERTRSIITIREIESIYRAFKNEVNNNDTDRYKEPEITAKTILHLLQKLNEDLSQKIIGVLLEDNDISIQMYVWQKKDLNFSETKYRSTWEAMKRNFNLTLIENSPKTKPKVQIKLFEEYFDQETIDLPLLKNYFENLKPAKIARAIYVLKRKVILPENLIIAEFCQSIDTGIKPRYIQGLLKMNEDGYCELDYDKEKENLQVIENEIDKFYL